MISAKFKAELQQFEWFAPLENFFKSPNWVKLSAEVAAAYKSATVYPPINQVFQVLKMNLNEVKVVIVGQDPYHGPGQANGLAFAVNEGNIIPPSLRNVFKELEADLNARVVAKGTLLGWQRQGVMLLNTSLTVKHGEAGSHSKIGWSELTDLVIKTVSDTSPNCVFILWGAAAKAKKPLIDNMKHGIIESGHPSPLSCKHFFGTKPFSKTNELLKRFKLKEINWLEID